MKAEDLLLTEAEIRGLDASLCHPDPEDQRRCFAHRRELPMCMALSACRAQAAKVLAALKRSLLGACLVTKPHRHPTAVMRDIIRETGLTWPPKEGA